ncbi:MAG: hypothetical protein ACLVAW_20280 [Eisenbergiella massiliensis]
MKNVICNAHLDPVWLWRWEEGCTEALSTFRTAERFTDEFPALPLITMKLFISVGKEMNRISMNG